MRRPLDRGVAPRYGVHSRRVAETIIVHPNRDKPASKATKAAVTLLLLASAALVAIVTVGGWQSLQGAQIIAIGYVIIFCVMAYYVTKWNRGVLPVASALAVLMMVVAAIAAPGWFDRDSAGFDNPGLPPSLLGLLTVVIVPLEFVLIVFAMRGFSQQWNVEVEVSRDDYEREGFRPRDFDEDDSGSSGYEPQPQGR